MAEAQPQMDAASKCSNVQTPKLREDDVRAAIELAAGADPGQSQSRARQASLPREALLGLPDVPWHISPHISHTPGHSGYANEISVTAENHDVPTDAVILDMPDCIHQLDVNFSKEYNSQSQYTTARQSLTAPTSPISERVGTRSAPAHKRDSGGSEASVLLIQHTESSPELQHDGYVSLNSASAGASRSSLAPYGVSPPSYNSAIAFTTKADSSIQTHDGVFANLAARPEIMVLPKPQDDPPPPYQTPVHLDARFYPGESAFGAEHTVRGGESGAFDEVVIDDLEVGTYAAFGIYFVVSALFEWVGFLMAYALSMTHSARYGSLSGLGLTIAISSTHFHDFAASNEWWHAHSAWIAPLTFIIAFTGYILLLFGLFAYHRMRIEAHEHIQSSGVVPPRAEVRSANRPIERRPSLFGNVYDNAYA